MISRQNISRTIYSVLRSNKFFYVTLGLFALGVAWMAIASLYPMAFDEEFHYGLIQIYATSWSPYGIQHTSDMAQYGSATADASYLFHYLMSFPYRLLQVLNVPDMGIIIALRFMNIALVVAAIAIFRKVLLDNHIGRASSNISMLFFMLLPTLSMLAAQINYDNLLLVIVSLVLLLTMRITRQLLAKNTLLASECWWLVILLLVGASVKYAFLPIAGGIVLWLIIILLVAGKKFTFNVPKQLRQLAKATVTLPPKTKIILIVAGILSLFFSFHYVINIANYGSPIPSCEKVFDEDACTAYGPWNRNRMYTANLSSSFVPISVPQYIVTEWIPGMSERLVFAIAGKSNGFQTKDSLPVVLIGFWVLTIIGLLCFLLRLIKDRFQASPFTWLTLLLCGIYTGVLTVQLYADYTETGVPVAINGRYLLLLLPLFGAVLLQSAAHYLKLLPTYLSALLITALIALFLLGGAGASTYLVQSEAHWFWPGFGQSSYGVLHQIWNSIILPFRFN